MSKNCCNFARFFVYTRMRKPYYMHIRVRTRTRKETGLNGKIINKQTYNEANLLFNGLLVLAANELAGANEGNRNRA